MELSIFNKKLTMDSRDIAKELHKSHAHILRDIRSVLEKIEPNLVQSLQAFYKDKYRRTQICYKRTLDFSFWVFRRA